MAKLPEYMKIRQYVMDMVASHHDNKLPTMSERELAKYFNVSRTTVRNALADLVADGVICCKSGVGMFVNPDRRNSYSGAKHFYKVLILMGNCKCNFWDGFHQGILAELFLSWKNLPLNVQLLNSVDRPGSLIDELNYHAADGIFWIRPPEEQCETIQTIRQNIPVQILSGNHADDPFNATVDFEEAGAKCARWFLQQKRFHPAFCGYNQLSDARRHFFTGWSNELAQAGLKTEFLVSLAQAEADEPLMFPKEIDGIFTFGAELDYLGRQLPESLRQRCAVISDDSPLSRHAGTIVPQRRIVLLPPESIRVAADNLYQRMLDPDFVPELRKFEAEWLD